MQIPAETMEFESTTAANYDKWAKQELDGSTPRFGGGSLEASFLFWTTRSTKESERPDRWYVSVISSFNIFSSGAETAQELFPISSRNSYFLVAQSLKNCPS